MDTQNTKALKPLDYLKVFFRRKWYIIIPTVIGLIAGIVACNVLPKSYASSTMVLVEEGRIINPLIQGLAVSTSTAQRLTVLREQILGWDRLLQLIKSLDLARDVKSQGQFEDLVKSLRKSINVNLRGSSIILISFEGKVPAQAQAIVKTITDIFIQENLRQQNKETDDAVTFINDQLALYQKKLKEAEIATMNEQLAKLLVDSTQKHPMVLELKKKIETARAEMDSGNYNVDAKALAGSDSELKNMKSELTKLKDEMSAESEKQDSDANRSRIATNSNDKLYKLLLLDKLSSVEARDSDVTQKLYNTLLERLETAKITQRLESSKEGTRYTILDPARLPLKPVKPNKVMVLIAAAFMGLSAGIGLVLLMEVFDHSFLGVDEAKAFLELPVFGAVSRIITEDDVRIEGIRKAKVIGLSLVTGVVLVIVIIFNVVLGS